MDAPWKIEGKRLNYGCAVPLDYRFYIRWRE